MATPKSSEDASIKDSIVRGEPITHFFYEFQGERSVEPWLLIEHGIVLWHEQLSANEVHDNSHLWQFAELLLNDRQSTVTYSWIEWLRLCITTGDLVPDKWDRRRAFPYKGLLIAAIYFQEARRLCVENNLSRVWHITAVAYYHLGMNTTASTLQNVSKAARTMHAKRTEKLRAEIVTVLELFKKDKSVGSIEQAKKKFMAHLLANQNVSRVRQVVEEFDASVPANTKGRTQDRHKNDVFTRIENLLDEWSLPKSHYPEVAAAFAHFSKKKRKVAPSGSDQRKASEDGPIDDSNCYLRLIHDLEHGGEMITSISRSNAE